MKGWNKTVTILAVFVILFLIGQIFFVPKEYVNSRIVSVLQFPFIAIRYFGNQQELVRQLSSLALENQSLRAQLFESLQQPSLVKDGAERYISAKIFSTYPFNISDQILIGTGGVAGVREGAAVLAAKGVFLGKITKIEESISTVQTILSPGWELPVKIGPEKVDALYAGSRAPKLTLISKNKTINTGDIVYLVSKEFPYGLTIGSVGSVHAVETGLFQEADLVLPYNLNELDNVLIIINEKSSR